jgi:hypothetical protein
MFAGWWSRKADKSLPNVVLPNLDSEVSAHWNRGVPPPVASPSPSPPEKPVGDNLDFGPAANYHKGKTKEQSRRRRRLLLSLLVGPLLIAAFIYFYPWISSLIHGTTSLGQRITFGPQNQEEIFYTADISSEQALQVGTFLQREGIFDGLHPKSVRLSKDGDVFVVGFVLEWGNWSDKDVANDFRDLLPRLSRGVFHGSTVEIHLCAPQPDSKGRRMPTMRVIRGAADGRK